MAGPWSLIVNPPAGDPMNEHFAPATGHHCTVVLLWEHSVHERMVFG